MTRRNYIDYLRALGCITIVALHLIGEGYTRTTNNTYYSYLKCLQILTQWAVPMFVMASGCNMLGRENEWFIVKKHIKKMARITILWGLIYMIADPMVDWIMRNPIDLSLSRIHQLFRGQAFHMWFCFMIMGMYLLIPILNPIIKEKRRCEYFILIIIISEVILPIASYIGNIIPVVGSVAEYLRFPRFGFYLAYFVLGYYLEWHANFTKRTRMVFYGIGVMAVGFLVINEYLTIAFNLRIVTINGLREFFNTLFAVAVFVFFKYDFKIGKMYPIVKKVADESMGIYLMHAYVYIRLSYKGIHGATINPLLAVPLVTTLIVVTCYLASRMIRKIPVVGKWLL